MSALDVFVLAADRCLAELMTNLLVGHRATICESPQEAQQLLAGECYDLVVITNFGNFSLRRRGDHSVEASLPRAFLHRAHGPRPRG
jgi:hypothetical protein